MKSGKIIFWSVLSAIVLGGGYFAYSKIRSGPQAKKKAEEDAAAAAAAAKADPGNASKQKLAAETIKTAALTKTIAQGFPLQRGSTGDLVKKMQQAMMDTWSKANTLPIYGADGIFGHETEAVLTAHGFPVVVTEAVYNNILNAKGVTVGNQAPVVINAPLATAPGPNITEPYKFY